jgi:hypothetical protein
MRPEITRNVQPELVRWLILPPAPLGDDDLQTELASARAGRAAPTTATQRCYGELRRSQRGAITGPCRCR